MTHNTQIIWDELYVSIGYHMPEKTKKAGWIAGKKETTESLWITLRRR